MEMVSMFNFCVLVYLGRRVLGLSRSKTTICLGLQHV